MVDSLITRVLILASLPGVLGGVSRTSTLEAQAQRPRSIIDGFVSDTNLVALGGATVTLLGSRLRVTTGENGRFRINAVPAGKYILTLHRVGYVPVASAVQIGEGDSLRLSFALNPIVTALDTMVVTAKRTLDRLSGFEQRRKLGFGRFVTVDDIERRSAIYVSDILRAMPDITVVETLRGETAYNTRTSHCQFQFVLDEVLLPTPTDLHLLPSVHEIAGIEVYYGPATIPLQYKSANSGCGVIIVWTKGG